MNAAGGARAVVLHMLETEAPGEAAGTLTAGLDLVQGHGIGGGKVTHPGDQGLTAGPDLAPSHHILAARAKAGTDRPTRSLMKAGKSLEANHQSDTDLAALFQIIQFCWTVFMYAPSQLTMEIGPVLSFLYSTSDLTCAGNKLQSCFCFNPVLQTLVTSFSGRTAVLVQAFFVLFCFGMLCTKFHCPWLTFLCHKSMHTCVNMLSLLKFMMYDLALFLYSVWLLPGSAAPTPVHKP